MGHPHLDHEGLGDGLDLHVAREEPRGVPMVLEGRPVVELELLHHAFSERARVKHVELGVEVLAVADGVARAHEGVGHGERRGVGRLHLQEGAGLEAFGLDLGGEQAQAQASQGGGDEEQLAAPEHVGVVTRVHITLGHGTGGGVGRSGFGVGQAVHCPPASR